MTGRGRAPALMAVAVLLLCGCAPTGTEAKESPVATTTTPSLTSTGPSPSCGSADAAAAVLTAVQQLLPPFTDPAMSDHGWTAAGANLQGYDPCTALSWVVVSVAGGTASSPSQVALFHRGDFLGGATDKAYGFTPTVTRLADDRIEVTYRWPQANESNAEASGRSVSQFTWDEQTHAVQRTGDLPPTP